MQVRITFEQALAFAIDRGAYELWVEGENLRYKAWRPSQCFPMQVESVQGYMKISAPLLEKYLETPKQLSLPFPAS